MPLGVAPTQQQLRSWRGHPLASASIRLVTFLTPIAAALVSSAMLSRLLPSPHDLMWRVLWWIALLAASTVVLVLTDRLARRALPLAALLKLSLVFPDRVPSRFSVALRSGTTKQLARRLQHAEVDTTTEAGATELLSLVAALNHHDPLTRGHSERVRAISELLADQVHLETDDREKLRWAALLHDIGKLRVPGEILRKPGRPTPEEWLLLKTHPAEGLELVRGPIADWLGDWTRAIGEHHEQFDGSGYPMGLAGTDIAYAGRLVAVADVFDVITAARSYKKPMTIQEARLEITRCAGTQFDPEVVRAFLQISIGDLRKAMGPLSWLAQLAIFGRIAAAPAASTLAGSMIALTGLGLGPVTSVYSEPNVEHTITQPHSGIQQQSGIDGPTQSVAPNETDTAIGAPDTGTVPEGAATTPGETGSTSSVTGTTVSPSEASTSSDGTTVEATSAPASTPAVTVPGLTVPSVTTSVGGAPATTLPAITTPTITVPAITLPPITVPAISLPPISLPPITVPITLPGVSIPPITVPTITVPPITVPPITVPPVTLPPITLPPITLPHL